MKIKELANEYMRNYLKENPTYPIKLSALCKDRGIKLCPFSDEKVQRVSELLGIELSENINGFVVFGIQETPVIFWDDRKSKEYQRSTIAHELGHIVLRHSEDTHRYADCAHCAELQADSFAFNFLFPEEKRKC